MQTSLYHQSIHPISSVHELQLLQCDVVISSYKNVYLKLFQHKGDKLETGDSFPPSFCHQHITLNYDLSQCKKVVFS